MKTTPEHDEKMEKMTYASVYPHYLEKVERKGRTKEELHRVIEWLAGFDTRKLQKLIDEGVICGNPAAFSLYVYSDTEKSQFPLPDLGKFKTGKICIYIKKLSDINLTVFPELCIESISYINEHHDCPCRDQ